MIQKSIGGYESMSDETKMYCRLLVLPAAVFAATLLACYLILTLTHLPITLGGGQVLWPNLPMEVYGGGAAISFVVFSFQMYRTWQWSKGGGVRCLACDCLMSGEKNGRYGPYRKCLGCSKNQSLTR